MNDKNNEKYITYIYVDDNVYFVNPYRNVLSIYHKNEFKSAITDNKIQITDTKSWSTDNRINCFDYREGFELLDYDANSCKAFKIKNPFINDKLLIYKIERWTKYKSYQFIKNKTTTIKTDKLILYSYDLEEQNSFSETVILTHNYKSTNKTKIKMQNLVRHQRSKLLSSIINSLGLKELNSKEFLDKYKEIVRERDIYLYEDICFSARTLFIINYLFNYLMDLDLELISINNYNCSLDAKLGLIFGCKMEE